MNKRALVIATSVVTLAISVRVVIAAFQAEPTVRIGLNQNAASVTVRSAQAFRVEQNPTRSAKFTPIVSVPNGAAGALKKEDLQYRMLVELDGGKLVVLPMSSKVRIEGSAGRLEYDNRTYRGRSEEHTSEL